MKYSMNPNVKLSLAQSLTQAFKYEYITMINRPMQKCAVMAGKDARDDESVDAYLGVPNGGPVEVGQELYAKGEK